MNCETCAERKKQAEPVPFIVHEAAMARMERVIRRLWILAIILVLLFVASNGLWLWRESQFSVEETTTETYTSEADGDGIAIVNRDGSVTYGQSDIFQDHNAVEDP